MESESLTDNGVTAEKPSTKRGKLGSLFAKMKSIRGAEADGDGEPSTIEATEMQAEKNSDEVEKPLSKVDKLRRLIAMVKYIKDGDPEDAKKKGTSTGTEEKSPLDSEKSKEKRSAKVEKLRDLVVMVKFIKDGEKEETEEEHEPSFVEKFLAKRSVRIVMLVMLVLYGLFQVLFLWMWVADALRVRKSLVFGPPSPTITISLTVAAVVGSVSFGVEVTSSVMRNLYNKRLLSEEVAELFTMATEEIPTVTLSALLSSCWEVPLSLYQLVKAAGAIFGSIFRAVRLLARHQKARRRGDVPRLSKLTRCVILLACVYCLGSSITVWVYSFHDREGEFRAPQSIKRKAYDHGRYLYKAGVYLTHPSLAGCRHRAWIKMASIYDIQESRQSLFEFYYGQNGRVVTHANMEFTDGNSETWFEFNPAECTASELFGHFRRDPNITAPLNITLITENSFFERPPFSRNGTKALLRIGTYKLSPAFQRVASVIRFSFRTKTRSKTRVFGDITYVAVTIKDGALQYLKTDEWGHLRTPCSDTIEAQFQYLKTQDNITDSSGSTFYAEEDTMTYRPYAVGEDAMNVTDAWKTGFHRCAMTGSLRPNIEDKMKFRCAN